MDNKFAEKQIKKWDDFIKTINKLSGIKDTWVYRGHEKDEYRLATSLERAQKYFGIDGSDMPGIEEQMIRHFRRGFPEEREDELNKDKLYCISLMQHHGAPTRLLDFTWSPYVGTFFALENSEIPPYKFKKHTPVLWCIRRTWIESEIEKTFGKKLLGNRWCDKERDDESFKKMYMRPRRKKFVQLENSIRLNTRLVIQQGIFLCPGDISCSFEENLTSLEDWDKKDNVLKIYFKFSKEERESVLETLRRMNVTQASLFPGLDGYSRSIIPLKG